MTYRRIESSNTRTSRSLTEVSDTATSTPSRRSRRAVLGIVESTLVSTTRTLPVDSHLSFPAFLTVVDAVLLDVDVTVLVEQATARQQLVAAHGTRLQVAAQVVQASAATPQSPHRRAAVPPSACGWNRANSYRRPCWCNASTVHEAPVVISRPHSRHSAMTTPLGQGREAHTRSPPPLVVGPQEPIRRCREAEHIAAFGLHNTRLGVARNAICCATWKSASSTPRLTWPA